MRSTHPTAQPAFAKAVLSGGTPITGWRKDGDVWRATVDAVKRGDLFFHHGVPVKFREFR